YLGLMRLAQAGLDIDFQVNLEFENINSPEIGVYGVDDVKVVDRPGPEARRRRRRSARRGDRPAAGTSAAGGRLRPPGSPLAEIREA
ncbi:hypothetical protein ACE14D_19325, partial [Streptomyces sp. Act-28]